MKILDEIMKQHAHNNSISLDLDGAEHNLKTNKYLIIIDKCRSFIRSDSDKFSEALNNHLKNTKDAIFLVISDSKEDLNE
jgi:hypothetical protein